jgi:NAD(P)H-hydrate epimerase
MDGLSRELEAFDLIIDAVGGTGVRGPLRDDLALAVTQINQASRPVVAVDLPTGLDCDTGAAEDPTVRAELTITFVAKKLGFGNPTSEDYTGQIVVADIGVPLGDDLTYLD